MRQASSFLVRLISALLLAGLAGWSALTAIDRADAASIARSSDSAFRARLASGLPDDGSFEWYGAIADRAMALAEPDTALAVEAYERALQMEARDGQMWGRFAYALYLDGAGREALTRALAHSYTHMPIGDWEYRKWRLQFVDLLWEELPPSIHSAAQIEAAAEDAGWIESVTPRINTALAASNPS